VSDESEGSASERGEKSRKRESAEESTVEMLASKAKKLTLEGEEGWKKNEDPAAPNDGRARDLWEMCEGGRNLSVKGELFFYSAGRGLTGQANTMCAQLRVSHPRNPRPRNPFPASWCSASS
jgi:hypothetical protein